MTRSTTRETSWVVLSLGIMSQNQMMGPGDKTLPQARLSFQSRALAHGRVSALPDSMCLSVCTSLIIIIFIGKLLAQSKQLLTDES